MSNNNYYNQLIEKLRKNSSKENLYNNIITPFSSYYLCDHFIGDEPFIYYLRGIKANNLIKNKNYDSIKEYDIVQCQGTKKIFYDIFCKEILPKINTKIILITSSYLTNCPSRSTTPKIEMVLKSPKIYKWFTQNPIQHPLYDSNTKYIPFPYGVNPQTLRRYVMCLLKTKSSTKKRILLNHLHCELTHKCRKILPNVDYKSPTRFFNGITDSKYILSPIGDRNDCFRHWESLGLGTIPVCNINNQLKKLFKENMYYVENTEEMIKMLKDPKFLNDIYKKPNKDYISLDYWRNYILTLSGKL